MVVPPSCPVCQGWSNNLSRIYKREVRTEEYRKTKRKFVPIGWQHNGSTYSSGCGIIVLDKDLKNPKDPNSGWKKYYQGKEEKN